MNLKDTMILLIFLLSVLGLIIGVYYSEDISNDKSDQYGWKRVYEDKDGVLTVSLEKIEKNELSKFVT